MSNGVRTRWRFLVIEDKTDIAAQLSEACPEFVTPDIAEVSICPKFRDALSVLESQRFDLLIIDLKDDSSNLPDEENLPGLQAYEEIKKRRFVPVVFYTALPKYVMQEQNAFVRVVEKSAGLGKLREEVRRVMDTKLPALTRHLENEEREYMWDFVSKHWREFESPHDQADLAYLLARRLALSLQGMARKLARKLAGEDVPLADPLNIHPMEMYVRPPISKKRLAGDILHGEVAGVTSHWLVLTPSCDFEHAGRLQNVLLAQCVLLAGEPEFTNWRQDQATHVGALRGLIGDNRPATQSERYKFLPGTFFLPDLVVDFQRLRAVAPADIATLEAIASLDSPFAEAVLSRFARYFGRLGTPDVDKNVVLSRLQAVLPPSPAGESGK